MRPAIGLPAAADLLPLRAVARLQVADLILHGDGAEAALELARRDAGRGSLGADLAEALAGGAQVVILAPPGWSPALPPGVAAERLAAQEAG